MSDYEAAITAATLALFCTGFLGWLMFMGDE